jgi:murein DD-endopeptidase MepM/ murein hydrolase activator NlpD
MDPFTKRPAAHYGIDFAGPYGAKVYATSDGVVVHSGKRGAYGNMIEIDHGMNIKTRFGHLSKLNVKEGDVIKKGDLIGIQGSTGRSTGHHLHYEVRYKGRAINPSKFLKAGEHVSEERL